MKVFIDAPLLIYLNTLTDTRTRIPYENLYLEALAKYKLYTDVLVLNEVIYVSKKRYGVSYDVSMEFIESNVLPYVYIAGLGEEEYRLASKFLIEYDLRPSDALHLGVMSSNGINTIISENKEFDRVPLIKRIWI